MNNTETYKTEDRTEVAGVPYIDEYGVEHDDLVFYKSNNGCKIRNASTGEVYDDAVELYPCDTKYYETDIPLDSGADEAGDEEDNSNNQEEIGGENDEE